MVKLFKKNLLLRNQWTDCLETWYEILGSRGLLYFIQMMTGLTLTQFTSRSNLVAYAFVWEKVEIVNFLESVVACEH